MKTLEDQINEEIAQVVERIVRLSRVAAIEALEKSFAQQGRLSPLPTAEPSARTPFETRRPRRNQAKARSHEVIAKLCERLLAAIRSNPGQPMTVLAPELGVKSSELQVPVKRLKAAKKIKTVGQRHSTCYFPVGELEAAA